MGAETEHINADEGSKEELEAPLLQDGQADRSKEGEQPWPEVNSLHHLETKAALRSIMLSQCVNVWNRSSLLLSSLPRFEKLDAMQQPRNKLASTLPAGPLPPINTTRAQPEAEGVWCFVSRTSAYVSSCFGEFGAKLSNSTRSRSIIMSFERLRYLLLNRSFTLLVNIIGTLQTTELCDCACRKWPSKSCRLTHKAAGHYCASRQDASSSPLSSLQKTRAHYPVQGWVSLCLHDDSLSQQ